ncbi:recombinase family protein [Brevundimonas sp.]|uniref:recombinase family protein n=1 Tax=Brevundimonas sp. TaxID=1871086 RepID=UPI002FC7F3BD
MNVIAYARFSTSEQQEGSSLARQFEIAESHASKHGWTITERLTDEGRSAFKAAHKRETAALGQFLRAVDDGRYGDGDILLIEALDRLSREEPMDALENIRRITRAGIRVEIINAHISLTRGSYEANAGSLAQLLFGAAFAHGESKRKSELLTAAWKKKREAGELRTTHPFWMDKHKTLIPERVEDVRLIFDLAERGFGRTMTARELTRMGRKSWGNARFKHESEWCAATVSNVIRNRAVTGECQAMSNGKPVGPVVADYYPQIISVEQFERVHAAPVRRFSEKGSGRRAEIGNIFKGWFNCSCGRTMQLAWTRDNRYLRCSGWASRACPNMAGRRSGMRYEVLEEGFLRALKEMTLVDTSSDQKRELEGDLIAAERGLEVARQNTTKLVDMLLDMDTPAIRQRLSDEESKARELENEIAQIKLELTRKSRTLDDEHAEAVNLYERFLAVKDDERVELRQRINQTLLRIIKTGQMSAVDGRFSVVMNDLTLYQFTHELKPDAVKRKVAGTKPATDFHWVAKRVTQEDAAMYRAKQITADGARETFAHLSDEQFEKAKAAAVKLLE